MRYRFVDKPERKKYYYPNSIFYRAVFISNADRMNAANNKREGEENEEKKM